MKKKTLITVCIFLLLALTIGNGFALADGTVSGDPSTEAALDPTVDPRYISPEWMAENGGYMVPPEGLPHKFSAAPYVPAPKPEPVVVTPEPIVQPEFQSEATPADQKIVSVYEKDADGIWTVTKEYHVQNSVPAILLTVGVFLLDAALIFLFSAIILKARQK